MSDFERLGVFYLGRQYDPEGKLPKKDLLLYDSKDLVTHAVCVGMTGSGKTGLCIGILEEAAIDGIPAIIVDPKGDLTNLLLTFPELEAEALLPWINRDDAVKNGLTAEEYAAKQADLWKKGLAEWGQDESRIQRLKKAADFTIYTPGSSSGLPISILNSFSAPEKVVREDVDLLTERVNTTVTSLLNMVGIDADPIRSREHILLSNILTGAWREERSLDLTDLIHLIQNPPVRRVGVFELESFFPEKDRFALAMSINNLLAAPAFQTWLEGEPLDIHRLMYTDQGRPRISIITISHLSETERMFFVSLLLTKLLGWMRIQPGTSSLRALFYMDEIFGYFPPVANPPSKAPLLTLLKQSRAYGLGILLATQNPVDLDYKGLSNCGTWFLGRLQTERDKERVLDGLEGVGRSSGGRFDRGTYDRILTGLGKRVFLMNNVHDDAPTVFQTRWVLSYLSGPMTRSQIKILMDPRRKEIPVATSAAVPPAPPPAAEKTVSSEVKPILPSGVPEVFLPVQDAPVNPGSVMVYRPCLLAMGRVYYASARSRVSAEEEISLLAEPSTAVNWDKAQRVNLKERDLEQSPQDDGVPFLDLPAAATQARNYGSWEKDFKDWLYRNHRLELFQSPSLGAVSEPGEQESDFRIRMMQAGREKRDDLVEKVTKRFSTRITSLEKQILKAQQAVEREKDQVSQQRLQTAISFGATLFEAMVGRKRLSRTSLGRATTTAQRAGRISREAKDVQRAEDRLVDLQSRLEELQNQFHEEIEEIKASVDPLTETLETLTISPRKSDIVVTLLALGWQPSWHQ